ncbi:FadR/GntR family transcriptional regulator [Yinghuangia seranimata]|uniref:FadR/GntR family transcriptional regulator n=1 Tax=Yinghuangia seranimata TaxID=408067 RepID=UPI00248B3F8A|nr:FCD domain-containing protein [Yinghuangia seranimata]MDI2132412.1 FCD domain-containing protein [Yinghuangia seranimata]
MVDSPGRVRVAQRPAGEAADEIRYAAIAEVVAGVLRRRILDGELADGDVLPKQDELMAEFDVGRTTLRQAIRILETEGLLTVRRGKVGGSVVHQPTPEDAARMFGMVMHTRHVTLADLAQALRRLEPVCVALCAGREDRADAVVPRLREVHERMALTVDDGLAYIRASREFHEAIVGSCGNQTMQIVLGMVETLWARQEQLWAERSAAEVGADIRRAGVREHEHLIDLIADGDETLAYRYAVRHLEGAHAYPLQEYAARPVQSGPAGA